MIAKLTSKNQLTIPKAIVSKFAGTRHFSVFEEDGRIVLDPLNATSLGVIRTKLQNLGITEDDVQEAVRWARDNHR